jgi:hypothetical protein
MARRTRYNSPGIMNFARTSFGIGLGIFGSMVVFLFLGGLLFIGGYVMVKKDKSKPKNEQNALMRGVGYFLMILGMALGLGFGAGPLLGEIGGEFS